MKGRAGHVLYLDFDGVLHHENVLWHPRRGAYLKAPAKFTLFQHAELLEHLLAPYPDVKIVLSTSWVRQYGCSKAAKNLPWKLRERVIGATFHSQMDEAEFTSASRGMQVWSDVTRRLPWRYLALDDDHMDWPKWALDDFVRTHPEHGISDPAVLEELKQKLARKFGSEK